MNQTKTKYALERVESILSSKLKELRAKYTKPGKVLSGSDKIKLIRQGKVKLFPRIKDMSHYARINDIFDFSKFETDEVINQAVLDVKHDLLLDKVSAVKDEIVLGDEEKALELIKKLQA